MFTGTQLINQECLIVLIGDFRSVVRGRIGRYLPEPRSKKKPRRPINQAAGSRPFCLAT